MLNRSEKKVMDALFNECSEKGATLVSPSDLYAIVGSENLSVKDVDEIVNALHLDGYFDLVYSDRHGESIYCITLTEKGKGFARSNKIMKRNLLFRIGLSATLAVFSFLIGLILKAIF